MLICISNNFNEIVIILNCRMICETIIILLCTFQMNVLYVCIHNFVNVLCVSVQCIEL